MRQYAPMLRRRATLLLIDCLVIAVFITVWMVARKPIPIPVPVPTTQSTHLTTAPVHILVQLAEIPEHPAALTPTLPMWTLYSDGTLIFRADPDDALWQAQLSPTEIQQLLDVIINQDTFFRGTAQRYGDITDEGSDDQLLLSVDVHGQQKEVILVGEPADEGASDLQTAHIFAIEEFLLDYHPPRAVLYVPSPDPDGAASRKSV